MGSYVPGTEQERTEMLREIGFGSIEQLFAHIPEEVKVRMDFKFRKVCQSLK